MKNSINNLRGLLTETEKLSTTQLCQLKGGGEDLRRNTLVVSTPVATMTETAKI